MSEDLKDFFFRTLSLSEQVRLAEGVLQGLYKRECKRRLPALTKPKKTGKPTGRACAPKRKPKSKRK